MSSAPLGNQGIREAGSSGPLRSRMVWGVPSGLGPCFLLRDSVFLVHDQLRPSSLAPFFWPGLVEYVDDVLQSDRTFCRDVLAVPRESHFPAACGVDAVHLFSGQCGLFVQGSRQLRIFLVQHFHKKTSHGLVREPVVNVPGYLQPRLLAGQAVIILPCSLTTTTASAPIILQVLFSRIRTIRSGLAAASRIVASLTP